MKNTVSVITPNNKLISLLGLFLCFFSACKYEHPDFTLEDFPSRKLQKVELVWDCSSALGIPAKMMYCEEDRILVTEPMREHQLTLLNLRAGNATEFLNQGRGPGEVLYAWDLSGKGGRPFVYDAPGEKILFYNLATQGRPVMTEEVQLSGTKSMYPRITGTNNGYVALSGLGSGMRLTLLNERLEKYKEVPFPDGYECGDLMPDNEIFPSWIGYCVEKDRIVVACQKAPYIDIFEGSGSLIRHLLGPVAFRSEFKEVIRGGGRTVVQDPAICTFSGLSVSKDYFMVGYAGSVESKIAALLLFSLDGVPLFKFELSEELMSFDVDWNDKMIYGIPSEGEQRIVAYSFEQDQS